MLFKNQFIVNCYTQEYHFITFFDSDRVYHHSLSSMIFRVQYHKLEFSCIFYEFVVNQNKIFRIKYKIFFNVQ